MRKILAAVIATILGISSPAMSSERFMSFPAIGVCTGTYVRYRDNPDTDGEIRGRLNAPERVIVFSQTVTDGDIWYEIGDPHGQDSAFVFGKYIRPMFSETSQQSELCKFVFSIMMNYGLTEESDYYEGPQVSRKYDSAGGLVRVEAWREGCSFGVVNIGDESGKIRGILGEPDSMDESEWVYRLERSRIRFMLEGGKVSRMIYSE